MKRSLLSLLSMFLFVYGTMSSAQETAPPPPAPAVSDPLPSAPVTTQPQTKERCTLGILPFTIGSFTETDVETDNGTLKITRTLAETEFTNQLMAFLVKSRKFNVLDRQTIRKVIDENKLTESEWAAPGQLKKIGQLLVADYLVLGSIDRCSFERKVTDIKITGERSVNWICTFKFNFHITQVKDGKVVYADTIIEKIKSRDIKKEIDPSEWRDWTLNDYKDLLFKRAADRAGNAILVGIYPVKISAITGDQVVLNRGEGAGISVGQKFNVFNQGAVIRDPDSGEVLGTDETQAGIIQVTSVEAKFSKANIVSAAGKIGTGAICRPVPEVDEDPAPNYPAAETPKW